MKKITILVLVLVSQLCNATWITSFEEGQKLAVATNKFMVVDFWATWCGPCKKMDMDSWSEQDVNFVLENYVPVKIDIDENKELATKYNVNGIPNIFIMDPNGKVVYSFLGYKTANELKKELKKFALSTKFLSVELTYFFKNNGFSTATRLGQKYLDYAILVDNKIKSEIIGLSDAYFSEARKNLSKKDEDYFERKQKMELLELYRFAYNNNFSKLDKKINDINEVEIIENNLGYYYFLKYISSKALKKEDFAAIDEKAKTIEGFDYFIKKADFILSKQIQ
jgi:thiol-disulfide isomerase/thioredoxin